MYIFPKYGIVRLVLFFVFCVFVVYGTAHAHGFWKPRLFNQTFDKEFWGVKMTFLFFKKILIFRSHLKLWFNIALLCHIGKIFYFILKFFNIS